MDGADWQSQVFRSSFPRAELADFRTGTWRDGLAATTENVEPIYPTIVHALAHAGRQDAHTGIRLLAEREGDPSEHRSYAALYDEAARVAGGLTERMVQPGDRVLLVLPTSHGFIAAFFGVLMVGAIPVPTYPPAALGRAGEALHRLRHVARSSAARWCITDRQLRLLIGELTLSGGVDQLFAIENLAASGQPAPRATPPTGAGAAFIQYTSGSTDKPKGVQLTHANLVSNVHAIGQALQINRHDIGVSWLPLYHDMGLIGALLFCIYWRLPLTLMSPTAFLADPVRWLRTISKERATLSPAPNFAYSLCVKRAQESRLDDLDLSSWRVALNGAEQVNAQTVRDFVDIFGPRGFVAEAMLPVYGLAEASLAVAFPEPNAAPHSETLDRAALAAGYARSSTGPEATELISVGRAVPGHRIVIVDDHGQPVPERQVGHVLVGGPSVMAGYYDDSAATEAILQDDLLWTGDLGYLSDEQLFITGRAKDILIIRGRNYYAEDLERITARLPGARPGSIAAFGVYDEAAATELAVIICETGLVEAAARQELATNIEQNIAADSGLRLDEIVLAAPGTIPKTPSGKPQRSRCRELYLRDQLEPRRTSKLDLARIFVRSGAGILAANARRILRTRRAPD